MSRTGLKAVRTIQGAPLSRKPTFKPDDPEQAKRFIEMGRKIGVDESDGAFERAFKKIVPPPRPSKGRQKEAPRIRSKTG